VVVPGVAFDRKGRRLGQGFGYYDRFLGALPEGVTRVGLAFWHQVVPEVPVDAWDVPVHALVTEEGVIRAARAPGPPKK
jgi:5-formyltetrahydrofolate cyclo-ligase